MRSPRFPELVSITTLAVACVTISGLLNLMESVDHHHHQNRYESVENIVCHATIAYAGVLMYSTDAKMSAEGKKKNAFRRDPRKSPPPQFRYSWPFSTMIAQF